MSGSTDSDILDRIPGIGDNSGDTDTMEGSDDSTPSQQTSDDTPSSDTPRLFENRDQQDQSTQQPDPNRRIQRTDGLVERQSQQDPRTRDLVDPATGAVVARGGVERRVYDRAVRAERERDHIQQQFQQLQAQIRGLNEANTIGNALRLTPEQQTTAMRIMADFQKDPVGVVEILIQEVKSKGYNIPSLNGQGGQTDMAAIQQMLDQRLAPLLQVQQQQRELRESQARAQQTLDNFLAEMPDAGQNLEVLAHMMQQDNTLSLEKAYLRFTQWCLSEGLDPTKPAGLQIQMRQQQLSGQQQPPANGQPPGGQPRQRPLPNGRSMNGAAPVARPRFDENSDWGEIIRDSLTEAGMRMN